MEPAAKIMVVDDEKGICQNVAKILSKNNYEVSCALSAKEALEKMSEDSYSLIISDLVMPEMNGLELLKKVKKYWPEMKSLMMTAYASTDTAMKAIRLGALDYLPKPFTPDELRNTVSHALKGDLPRVQAPVEEVETIDVIDFDIPFEPDEVAKYTGEEYVRSLGPSDMPVVEVRPSAAPEHYCKVGDMVCDIFKKLGATCKAGVKTTACPQKKGKALSAKTKKTDISKLIGVDMPFNYDEVISVTGPEYVANLHHEGVSFVSYETLKKNVAALLEKTEEAAHARQIEAALSKTVLIIDDEIAVNNNMRKILAKKGYKIDQASDKKQALEKIGLNLYGLILLDLRIPGVEGLELLKVIRAQLPDTKVIIVTGYASIETAVEAARFGVVDYIAKPFTPAELRTATERALRQAA